jgi:heme-degrading monooxygenase HmoA
LLLAVKDTHRTTKGELFMEHIRIATYTINKGTFQELAETARTGMLPKFQTQPGFVRYGLADMGDRTAMSISVWETREQAEAATPAAATWVGEHLADHVQLKTNTVGDLAFFKGVPARV